MNLPHINYGDTLVVTCTYQDASGNPVNLTTAGTTVSATITAPDGIETVGAADIVVTLADQTASPGVFTIQSDSLQWCNLIGQWSLLIRYTNAAGIKSSADRVLFELC